MTLDLVILSPNGVVYEGQVSEAYFPLGNGPIGIYPGHTPYLGQLKPSGVIKIKEVSFPRFFAVKHGALQVKPDNKVIVVTENAVEASSEEEAIELAKGPSFSIKLDEKDVEKAEAKIAQNK